MYDIELKMYNFRTWKCIYGHVFVEGRPLLISLSFTFITVTEIILQSHFDFYNNLFQNCDWLIGDRDLGDVDKMWLKLELRKILHIF